MADSKQEVKKLTINLTAEQIGKLCNSLNRTANYWEDKALEFKGEPSPSCMAHSQVYHALRNAIIAQIGGE